MIFFVIAPWLLSSIGIVMVLYTSFEFFVAQSPWHVKGVIICMAVQSFGVIICLGSILDMLLENYPINLFPQLCILLLSYLHDLNPDKLCPVCVDL